MKPDTLRLFARCATLGSFAAVAREERCDPSVISRAIADLERDLGTRLFSRSTRSMALTQAGRLLLPKALTALDALEEVRDSVREDRASVRGLVRIGASVALGTRLLVPALGALQARHPDLSVQLVLDDGRADVSGAGLDLFIRHGPPLTGEGVVRKLFDTAYRLVHAPTFGAALAGRLNSPADLDHLPCLGYAISGMAPRWQFRMGATFQEVSVSGPLSASSPLALERAALEGHGLALLADWLVADALKRGDLVVSLGDWEASPGPFDSAAWLLYPDRQFMPARVRTVIDFLVERFSAQ